MSSMHVAAGIGARSSASLFKSVSRPARRRIASKYASVSKSTRRQSPGGAAQRWTGRSGSGMLSHVLPSHRASGGSMTDIEQASHSAVPGKSTRSCSVFLSAAAWPRSSTRSSGSSSSNSSLVRLPPRLRCCWGLSWAGCASAASPSPASFPPPFIRSGSMRPWSSASA